MRGRGATRHESLVVIAIDLFIEGLGIKRFGRTGDPSDDEEGKKGGRDRFHGLRCCDLGS